MTEVPLLLPLRTMRRNASTSGQIGRSGAGPNVETDAIRPVAVIAARMIAPEAVISPRIDLAVDDSVKTLPGGRVILATLHQR